MHKEKNDRRLNILNLRSEQKYKEDTDREVFNTKRDICQK